MPGISDDFHSLADVRAGRAKRQHRGADLMYRKRLPTSPKHPYSSKWYEIPADYDVPVLACETGRVALAEDSPTGWWVVLDLGQDVGLAYHHLRSVLVKPGAFVGEGTPLGLVGGSPRPGDYGLWHLHFDRATRGEFNARRMRLLNRLDGVFEDPAPYLAKLGHVALPVGWG